MRRFFVLAALVGVLLASAAPPASAVINGLNGMTGSTEIDARAYGVKCDGTTDDSGAFSAAYDALTTSGGTIVVPYTGSACMIGSDVGIESNVKLRCERGATLKWTSSPTVTLAMFSGFVTKNNVEIRDCNFDLNGQAKSAVWLNGSSQAFVNNTISNGATSSGSAWSMGYVGGNVIDVSNNIFACANTAGAKDSGIYVNAANAGVVSSNAATACDNYGIQAQNGTVVIGNHITTIGASAYGIYLTGGGPKAIGNTILASAGASPTGIYSTGVAAVISDNSITTVDAATTGVGIYAGGLSLISGNYLAMGGNTAGTEAEVAIDITGLGTRVIGNVSNFVAYTAGTGVDESNWHIRVGAQQVRVMGNYLLNGKYGVAPNNSAASTEAINCYVIGNEIWGLSGAGSIAVTTITGWFVDSNYIAWNEYTSISVGDARGTIKAGTSHTKISANRMHSLNSTGQGVVFAPLAKTCDSGDKTLQVCTTDDTNASTGCPNGTCPNCCDLQSLSQITIVGNEFLYGGTGAVIDIANAITGSGSAPITNVLIDGSVAQLGASQNFIGFPASNQNLVTKVVIGDFTQNGNTTGVIPIANLTAAQGTLTMYPPIIADLPAGGCIGTAGFSFWNLPASNAPAPGCFGSTYIRGVLDFDATTNETAYSDIVIPPAWTGAMYADVWWTAAATTGNVIWKVEAVCVADTEAEDPAFSSTANSSGAVSPDGDASDINKDTITLSNASWPLNCAAGEVMHLKFYRDAATDTMTGDARMMRVTLRQW